MNIRPMTPADQLSAKRLECGYTWEFGGDFMGGWVAEEDGKAIALCGFWRRAEGHLVIDHNWKTPQERLALLRKMHESVEPALRGAGVFEVWTFMDDMRGFGRKLKMLGWRVIQKTVWGRRTDG